MFGLFGAMVGGIGLVFMGWYFGRGCGLGLNCIVVCLSLGLVFSGVGNGWFLVKGLVLGWSGVVVVWFRVLGLVCFV